MLINQAFAQDAASAVATTAATTTPALPQGSSTEMLLWNIGFIVVIVFLFYLLLIRPQQVRFRHHTDMLKALKKGEKVVLQSGLIGVIHEFNPEKEEAVVEIYEGVKARIMRSAIAGRYEDFTTEK